MKRTCILGLFLIVLLAVDLSVARPRLRRKREAEAEVEEAKEGEEGEFPVPFCSLSGSATHILVPVLHSFVKLACRIISE